MNIKNLVISIAFLILTTENLLAGDINAGQQKSQTCAACHAADGNSINPIWPKLAGQHAKYIESQLKMFKSGDRENAQMSPMTANLSEQDMADLAAFYSSQPIKHGQTQPDNVETGAKVYRAGNADTGLAACIACHGPRGKGNPAANYPAVGGQHAAYIANQLNAYRTGARSNPIMHAIANKMSDDEIKVVADYLQGLH